jgi:glycosyltransferase involved in cell wall biosynthesis
VTRIAVLADRFPERSQTFVATEARALQRLGAQVRVEAGAAAEHAEPSLAEGLDVAYLGDARAPERARALAWLLARAPRRCLADLRSRARWRAGGDAPVTLRELAPVARRVHARGDEHLHAHFAAGAALTAMRIAALLDLPWSVTAHGYDIFREARNLPEKLARASFATSGSEFTVAALRAHGVGRIEKVVMGVDGDAWRRDRGPSGEPLVVAVGRLVDKKGFATLVHAAARLRDGGVRARVVIAGDGPLRGTLESLVAELRLHDLVQLPGAVSPAQVRELLTDAAVCAVPSVTAQDGDAESMPVIAKEALAMEVPVVASDVAGLPEVVRPAWGRLVAPGDAAALAAALAEVLALAPRDRAALGAAGRAFVTGQIGADAQAARLLGLIQGVSASGPVGPARPRRAR